MIESGSRMGMLIEVYTVESGVGKMANGSAGVTDVTSYFVLQYHSRTSTSATYTPLKLFLSVVKIATQTLQTSVLVVSQTRMSS